MLRHERGRELERVRHVVHHARAESVLLEVRVERRAQSCGDRQLAQAAEAVLQHPVHDRRRSQPALGADADGVQHLLRGEHVEHGARHALAAAPARILPVVGGHVCREEGALHRAPRGGGTAAVRSLGAARGFARGGARGHEPCPRRLRIPHRPPPLAADDDLIHSAGGGGRLRGALPPVRRSAPNAPAAAAAPVGADVRPRGGLRHRGWGHPTPPTARVAARGWDLGRDGRRRGGEASTPARACALWPPQPPPPPAVAARKSFPLNFY